MTDKNTLLPLLGKPVHIRVDRPIGYCHKGLVYPVNYGYVPGLMAADGEEQDAYILGVSVPLDTFDGWVIGIVHRHDDCEDKLVVAPEGMVLHQGQIADAVDFQEQFFSTSITCLLRRSCGVIPFRKKESQTEFLILRQTNDCWSFPKGHMEAGETETKTALRELKEETGLEATLLPLPPVTVSYSVSSITQKQVVLFPGQVSGSVVTQQSEITDHRWVSLQELSDYLHPDTFTSCKTLLEKL